MNNTEFIDSFKCKKAFLKKRLFYLNLIQVTFTFFILPAFFFIFTDYTNLTNEILSISFFISISFIFLDTIFLIFIFFN